MKTSCLAVLAVSLALAGCAEKRETTAPPVKSGAAPLPGVAAPAASPLLAAPAAEAVAPPPGTPAAVTAPPSAPSTSKVIVPGSADDPNVMPAGFIPKPTPRQYAVNGQVDLQALTEALRDYCMWKKAVPAELNELVTSKYLPSLPEPPAGQKYAINPGSLEVSLIKK